MTRRFAVRLVLALAVALSGAAAISAQQTDRFYIVGFVKNPGVYHLKDSMTVGDALDAAGGFAINRNVTGIEIIRIVDGEKQTVGVTLNDAVLHNDTINVK
jgi:protein involved in polysaccharide export with SLBB domain